MEFVRNADKYLYQTEIRIVVNAMGDTLQVRTSGMQRIEYLPEFFLCLSQVPFLCFHFLGKHLLTDLIVG